MAITGNLLCLFVSREVQRPPEYMVISPNIDIATVTEAAQNFLQISYIKKLSSRKKYHTEDILGRWIYFRRKEKVFFALTTKDQPPNVGFKALNKYLAEYEKLRKKGNEDIFWQKAKQIIQDYSSTNQNQNQNQKKGPIFANMKETLKGIVGNGFKKKDAELVEKHQQGDKSEEVQSKYNSVKQIKSISYWKLKFEGWKFRISTFYKTMRNGFLISLGVILIVLILLWFIFRKSKAPRIRIYNNR